MVATSGAHEWGSCSSIALVFYGVFCRSFLYLLFWSLLTVLIILVIVDCTYYFGHC